MDEVTPSTQKLQKCITNSWNAINGDFKKYLDTVSLGEEYVSGIISHKTILPKVVSVNIENTELYKMKPDIQLMLQHSIERSILSEELELQNTLKDLHRNFVNILVQIDKIFNVYRSMDIEKGEIIKATETSLSFAEMLEALDRFKRVFTENHNGRQYTVDSLHFTDDFEKISSLWKVSKLKTLKQDLDLILQVE